jgi:hypothetical protein
MQTNLLDLSMVTAQHPFELKANSLKGEDAKLPV